MKRKKEQEQSLKSLKNRTTNKRSFELFIPHLFILQIQKQDENKHELQLIDGILLIELGNNHQYKNAKKNNNNNNKIYSTNHWHLWANIQSLSPSFSLYLIRFGIPAFGTGLYVTRAIIVIHIRRCLAVVGTKLFTFVN